MDSLPNSAEEDVEIDEVRAVAVPPLAQELAAESSVPLSVAKKKEQAKANTKKTHNFLLSLTRPKGCPRRDAYRNQKQGGSKCWTALRRRASHATSSRPRHCSVAQE